MQLPSRDSIETDVRRALAEDLGRGDVTASLVPANARGTARVITREDAVLAGTAWFDESFRQVDGDVTIRWQAGDGQAITADNEVCRIEGSARSLLTAERTALNFLQLLSGVARETRRYADAVAHTGTRILDTRKTIPGLRLAQKYAVTCGGGHNHRIGLFDAFLIKENHIAAAGSIAAAVNEARRQSDRLLIEVEVENLDQLQQAIAAGARRVMLDNFDLAGLAEAVQHNAGRVELEASGGVELDALAAIAETGVDYISVGALTKHVQAVDFSMRFLASDSSD